jgi:hypothetical protein
VQLFVVQLAGTGAPLATWDGSLRPLPSMVGPLGLYTSVPQNVDVGLMT